MTSETDLAKRFGLPRSALKAARDAGAVQEGTHWENVKGKGIQYREGGIVALYQWLEAEKNSSKSEASESPENVCTALVLVITEAIVDVTISRIWHGNDRRMLIDHDGAEGVLQVKTTKNFMVGMSVKAQWNKGSTLYHYRGRYPRRKGQL